jgi:hypothetical protein
MILVNAAGIQYHNRVIPVLTTAIGMLVIILDVYLNPTRRKVLFYSISVVLLALLWIALDQEWITPIMLI